MRKRIALAVVVGAWLGVWGPRCHGAESAAEVVYLTQSRDWLVFQTGWGDGCPLARELVRQAFLMAARDELGLLTRDGWLGSEMPDDGENAPWEFRAQPQDPTPVRLLRGFPGQQRELFVHELRKPVRAKRRIDYRQLTEMQERLSRTEYVDVLKTAGYTGRRPPQDATQTVPATTEHLLNQMTVCAQFRALRELHAQMGSQGESPALLGALVRGYAHLGLLTEYYWHPAHKVFKARALLYAQRMVAQAPESPLGLWHRAYAAALTSDDRWTAQDLQEAEKVWEALPEGNRPAKPAWLPLIGAMCHYQVEAFLQPLEDLQLAPLASLLRFITVERAGCQTWAVQTAMEVLPVLPECYRVHDSLCQFAGATLLESATQEPIVRAGQTLYTWVRAMPDLPEEVRRTLPEAPSLGSLFRAALPEGSPTAETSEYQAEEEFPRRRQLTEALLQCGAAANTSDRGEPAWETLGLLIRELSFQQVYRRSSYEGVSLGWNSEEWLSTANPLVEGHPCQAVLQTFGGDYEQLQAAHARLLEIDRAGLEPTAYVLYEKASNFPELDALLLFRAMWRNLDLVTRDLVLGIRAYGYSESIGDRRWMGQTLLRLSADSPMAYRVLIETDWDAIQEKIPAWKEAAQRYPGLASALAEKYLRLKQPDEAEPMVRAALKMVPFDLALRRELALLYDRRGQHDRWREILEEQLQQPDYYRDHLTVQSEIAQDYMKHKHWEKAIPYAEAIAEAEEEWGLSAAAQCYEALQRFEEAQQLLQAYAERYGNPMPWYFFCRRTGHGDLATVREMILSQAAAREQAEVVGSYDYAAYYQLEGQLDLALREIEETVTNWGRGDDALWMALIADQAGDSVKRDRALDLAKELAANRSGRLGASSNGIVSLTLLLQKDLAEGGQGKIDLELAERCLEPLDGLNQFLFRCGLAQYLNHHGQPERALGYFKQCLGWTGIDARYRALAGAALVESGITPAEYQDLLQPDPNAQEFSAILESLDE